MRHAYALLYGIGISLTMLFFHTINCASRLDSLKAFFGKMPYKEVMQKKYPLDSHGTLTLNNFDGNISVTTHAHNVVHIIATKSSNKLHMLPELQVREKVTTTAQGQHCALTISSTVLGEHSNTKIDYQLTIPQKTILNISTDSGKIYVDQISAPTQLYTKIGSITIGSVSERLTVSIEKQGDIKIDSAFDQVHATTHYGNITVKNLNHNLSASILERGNILVTQSNICPTGHSNLTTKYGLITVFLPHNMDSSLNAKAMRGSVISDHIVTLSPLRTTLDKCAWDRFRQEVSGRIGSAKEHVPQLTLANECGDIKIMKKLADRH